MEVGEPNPSFPEVAAPRASIVIPVHGKVSMTLVCLDTVARSGDRTPFEVIVVDDCSPDDTAARLAAVRGLVTVSTPTNVGFVGACNVGAQAARGDVIVFLNNDTLVHPGWLDKVMEVFDEAADVGAVGSMTIDPHGLVLESGGIIWSDGTGWNFGRGQSPSAGAVRSRRDVDYCSGAALAIRRPLFESIGGFDTRYAPAYYEDTDLCFAVRAAGYRVVVEPESIVSHYEGSSNGADGHGGLKRFQVVNRLAFARKWREALAHQRRHDDAGDVWEASNRAPAGMVLVVEPIIPTPDRDSGSRRMAGILAELLDLGAAVYYAVGEHVAIEPYRTMFERRGVTVLESEAEQREFLEQAGRRLRCVMLCRPDTAWRYIDLVYQHAPQATIVYDTVDLHALRIGRQAAVHDDEHLAGVANLVWIKERAIMAASDVTLVVSKAEQAWLAEVAPDVDVRVLSNIHAPAVRTPTLDGRADIVFVGSYLHPPNVDAARWVATEVMPLVWRSLPDATLRLIGSYLPTELEALACDRIDAVGWVADLEPCYRVARVVVAPMRYGAGVKGKVAEAIEHGVPVVATSIALEGMGLVDGEDVLRADDAETFAAHIVRLMTDDRLWQAMAGHGQGQLEREFSSSLARDALEEILRTPPDRSHRRVAWPLTAGSA